MNGPVRRMRRRTRQILRFHEWPWRRQVALGVWVPVAVVAFFLFTGPNGASSATPPPTTRPATVTTVKPPLPKLSVDQLKQTFVAMRSAQLNVNTWVQATPRRLTLAQQTAKNKWRAVRRKQLLGQHRAAVASSRHKGG
jgi:hypothetical protein